jgi:hypothetical protein
MIIQLQQRPEQTRRPRRLVKRDSSQDHKLKERRG